MITIQLTKKHFDAHMHRNGVFNTEKYTYLQYMASKDVFNQLCPKEYQDGIARSNSEHVLKATANRLLVFNKLTNERLAIVCI